MAPSKPTAAKKVSPTPIKAKMSIKTLSNGLKSVKMNYYIFLNVIFLLQVVTAGQNSEKFEGDLSKLTCDGNEVFGLLTTSSKSHPMTKIKGKKK